MFPRIFSVVLRDVENNPFESYVNANFIRGLDDAPDIYIAAQVLFTSQPSCLCVKYFA